QLAESSIVGTGTRYSAWGILDVVRAEIGRELPLAMRERRPGVLVTDPIASNVLLSRLLVPTYRASFVLLGLGIKRRIRDCKASSLAEAFCRSNVDRSAI